MVKTSGKNLKKNKVAVNKESWLLCAVLLSALLITCLVGCGDKEITAITPLKEEIVLSLDKYFYIGNNIEVIGKGKLNYAVENPDVISLDGEKVTAVAEGTGYVIVSGGSASCRIKVTVIDGYRINVTLESEVYVYDGTVKKLAAVGNFPEGTDIKYYCNGELFVGTAEPGVYNISIEVAPPDGYYVEYVSQTAVLTIERIKTDMNGVKFEAQTYTYDGTEKRLSISGKIPEWVSVRLDNNVAVDAGIYTAKAYFTVDERYYEPVTPLTARLTILKKTFELDYSDFSNTTVNYDGMEHFPSVALPEGVRATISVFDEDPKVYKYIEKAEYFRKYAKNSPFIKSGSYKVKAEFELDELLKKNYNKVEAREITVTIAKATVANTLTWVKKGGETGVGYDYIYSERNYSIGHNSSNTSYDIGLTGALLTGVNGEFPEGLEPVFYYGKQSGSSLTVTSPNAGSHTVTVRFITPEGWNVNYREPEEMKCSIVIAKADYQADLTFDGRELEGEKDYNNPQIFDGKTHYFALKFKTEELESAFLKDVKVSYYYVKNGRKTVVAGDKVGLLDVGNYTVGYELSFINSTYRINYNLPPNASFNAVITPIVYDMSAVEFLSKTVIYNGSPQSLAVTGLPDGVAVEYINNAQTDAGVYEVTANFSVAGMSAGNYYLKGKDGEINSLKAQLTINKAYIEESSVPGVTVNGGEYSPNKTLKDYPILGGNGNMRWQNPDTVPVCGNSGYIAVYNTDKKNYYDYSTTLKIEITQVVLDGSLLKLNEQFIPYTGRAAVPKLTYDGEVSPFLNLTYRCETETIGIGSYLLTDLIVSPLDEINYRLEGNSLSGEVVIHIYNGNLFEYDGLILKKYKGLENTVTVQQGTRSVYADAFYGKAEVTALFLPSSLEALSINALRGLTSLRELTLPFTGARRDTPGAIGAIFGGNNGDMPVTLTDVTVTEMTAIPSGAFKNAAFLTSVKFTKDVTEIGASAFEGCSNLETAEFPYVERLEENAFRYCFNLKNLSLPFVGASSADLKTPSHLFGTDIGDNAYRKYSLAVLNLSSGSFTSLPANSFLNLINLQTIVLPDTLRQIAANAFSGTAGEFTLNENFTAITEGMFAGYKGIKAVLPSKITRIEKNAFSGATELRNLYLPSTLNYIGENAFSGYKGTLNFAKESTLTRLETRALAGYGGATVNLPDSVTEIGDYAFYGAGIESITVKESMKLNGDYIFAECTKLVNAYITAEELPYKLFANCKSLENAELNGVISIGAYAFENCAKLMQLILPEKLNAVGDGAFKGCYSLSRFYFCSSAMPTLGVEIFPSVGIIVIVPEHLLAVYKPLEDSYNNITVIKSAQ